MDFLPLLRIPTGDELSRAVLDLTAGLSRSDAWLLLGVNDIKIRYSRSSLGQFWITLTMAIFTLGIGLTYSQLFHQPIENYLPYLAVNVTVWTLISAILGESTAVFIQAAIYLRQDAFSKSIFVMRLLVRNLIVFAHNLIIIPVVFLACNFRPAFAIALLALPGLLVVTVTLFFAALALGTLAARFRDLAQVVQNVLQLLFFITPVMWQIGQMDVHLQYLVQLNPFAALLTIVADPMRGTTPSFLSYLVALLCLTVTTTVSVAIFARFRARVVYWL